MSRHSIHSIVAAGVKIPPCPQVLVDLRQVLQDPDSGNQQIVRLIERDIKLASAVFKTGNSASIAPGRKKFETLDQAVAMIGRRAIGNIVNAAALLLACGGPDKRLTRFWERSLEVAMLCSIVSERAPHRTELSPEQHFTAGLFHDCGVAVLIQHFPHYCKTFGQPIKAQPDISAEDDIHQTCHCTVGQMIAKEWGLPDYIYETIRCHHFALEKVPAAAAVSIATLYMSLHIANAKLKIDDSEWAAQRTAVMAALGLSEETIDKFEQDVWSSFEVLH